MAGRSPAKRPPRTATRPARPRSAAGRAKPAAAYHHGDLRRALIEVALELVRTRGSQGLTLRGVARLAGVSPAAPYRHFANKDALLAAVAEEGFRHLSRTLQGAAEQAGNDPALRFRRMGVAYVQFACGQASQYSLMFGRGGPDKGRFATLDAAANEAFELLVGAVAQCQTAEVIRPADPRDFALAAWALMHGLATLAIEGQLDQALSSAEGLDQVTEMVGAALFEGLQRG